MRLTTPLPIPLFSIVLLGVLLGFVGCVPPPERTPRDPDAKSDCTDIEATNLVTVDEDRIIQTAADFDKLPSKCWDLRGKLTLKGPNITSLAKLDKLVAMDALEIVDTKLTKLDARLYVYETVTISSNDVLADLGQLEVDQNIAEGDVVVDDNDVLVDLGRLEDLAQVRGDLTITYNAKLPSLVMHKLTEVGGETRIETNAALQSVELGRLATPHDLYVTDNAALTTFGALSARKIVGNITFRGNKLLTSLGTMSSLESMEGNLTIDNNAALANISMFSSSMKYLIGNLTITNNPQLTDLGQLSRLTAIGPITINTNLKLPFCKAQEIEHCVPQHGSVSIVNNLPNSSQNCTCWCGI